MGRPFSSSHPTAVLFCSVQNVFAEQNTLRHSFCSVQNVFAEPNCLKTARSGPPRMRWKGSPQRGVPVRMVRLAGVHGILPFHITCSMSMVSRATAKLMKQHKIRKGARSFAKPCPYKASRCLQRRFWYSHRDSNPNRQNRNLKSYPLDYGSKRGQEQMPPCGIDFPYLRCKVNYFND